MNSKNISVGLIGFGRIGKMHAKNINDHFPTVDLKSIVDPSLVKGAAGYLNIENVYDSVEHILTDQTIKAVIIASPTPSHYELIKQCAEHKKHIFCEKPLSFSENRIREIIDIQNREGILFQVGLNRRFDRNFMKIKEKIDDGMAGEIHMIQITNHDANIPEFKFLRSSGGMLLDLCVHDFDMLKFLTGQDIKEIYVNGGVFIEPKLKSIGDIDNALITIELENGILCSIDSSRQTHYGYDQRVEIFGSMGIIYMENEADDLCSFRNKDDTQESMIKYSFIERYERSYVHELEHFFQCVLSGTQPNVGPKEILSAIQVAMAGKESIDRNSPQRVQR